MKTKMNHNSFSTIYVSELDSQFFTLSKILYFLDTKKEKSLEVIREQLSLFMDDITFFLGETFGLNFIKRKAGPNLKDFEQLHFFALRIIELDLTNDFKLNFLVDYLNLLHGHTLKIQQQFINIFGENFQLPTDQEVESHWNWQKNQSKAMTVLKQVEGQNETVVFELERKRHHLFQDFIKDAQSLLELKDYKAALIFLNKAAKLKRSAQLLLLMAHCEYQQGLKEKALKYCLEAMRIEPNYAKAYIDLGQYIAKDGKWREALEWFKKAKNIKSEDFHATACLQSAKIYIKQKLYAEALRELEAALPWTENNPDLKDNINKLLLIIEDRDKNLIRKGDDAKTFH
jgi:tetratricopeptide (TPR) repeat protein